MRRSPLVVGVALFASLLVTVAFGQSRRDGLERQRQNYEQQLKSLIALDAHQMSDVLQLRIEDGHIALHTRLTPWRDFMGRRADIEGLASPAIVTFTEFGPPPFGRTPAIRQFDLDLEQYPDPDTFVRTHLNWRPGNGARAPDVMALDRNEQTSDSYHHVSYSQMPGRAMLIVINSGAEMGGDRSFNVAARDFVTLRRKYPTQVEQWLRPIFRELRQEAAFAPEADTAWQVLADDWPVVPETRDRVRALLPDLNSEQSKVRNRAADALARLGLDGATVILRINRAPLSLEQNVRLDEVLSRFRHLPAADAARLRNDADFLMDCGYCENVTARALAFQRLSHVLGHDLKMNPAADEVTRARCIETVRAALHPAPATQPIRPTTAPSTQPAATLNGSHSPPRSR